MSSELKGLDQVVARLRSLASRMQPAIGRALYAEGQIERQESMRRTPVDTGALRASHVLEGPMYSGRDIWVRIGVGGPAAPYAVVVHENMDAFHKVGQAKFLESTILESAPYIARRVAVRLKISELVA